MRTTRTAARPPAPGGRRGVVLARTAPRPPAGLWQSARGDPGIGCPTGRDRSEGGEGEIFSHIRQTVNASIEPGQQHSRAVAARVRPMGPRQIETGSGGWRHNTRLLLGRRSGAGCPPRRAVRTRLGVGRHRGALALQLLKLRARLPPFVGRARDRSAGHLGTNQSASGQSRGARETGPVRTSSGAASCAVHLLPSASSPMDSLVPESPTVQVSITVLSVTPMRAGKLFALAAVEIDIDGLPIEVHGIRAVRVPPAATRIELPTFATLPAARRAILLPGEVRRPIGDAVLRPMRSPARAWTTYCSLLRASGRIRGRLCPRMVQAYAPRYGPARPLSRP